MTAKMPQIDLNKLGEILTASEFELAQGIVSTRGKNKGCLRASKPKVEMHVSGKDKYGLDEYQPDPIQGKTAFLWRHVAFSISPLSPHHCMPVMDFCDLPGHYGPEMRELEKELMNLADKIIKTVDVSQWHGVKRWGQVFGKIGTPRYNEEGAIIYR